MTVLSSDDEAAALWENIARPAAECRFSGAACSTTIGTWACQDRADRAARSMSTAVLNTAQTAGPSSTRIALLEIWNLVFMQEELSAVRKKDDFDVARDLPRKNIDTGMGLERVAVLLQGVDNLYEIDQVYPVIDHAAQLAGKRYGGRHGRHTAPGGRRPHPSGLMLIADRLRRATRPGGYVLRRLLRRVVRAMRLLGVAEPVLPSCCRSAGTDG